MQSKQVLDSDFFDNTAKIMQFSQVGFLNDLGREPAELLKG